MDTLFIGKTLHEFDALPSTNQFAYDLLSEERPAEGTVIMTHDQYAGKGQATNKWESEPHKNLTFTTILYPKFLGARKQFLLNQVVSLSVFDTLSKHVTEGLKIKWPNDLYVFDKKITGILMQNSLKGSVLQSSVIGVGINVNQKQFVSDAPNPTSLVLETGKLINVKTLLSEFCQQLEKNYLQLKAGQSATIQQRYLNTLYQYNQNAHYQRKDQSIFKGKIIGVTDTGKLKIKTSTGIEEFFFKEVKYLR
ncbi:MAG: biotin--[acetyl-CoA-carboxylase] ligase [Bacteroidota bacterium]